MDKKEIENKTKNIKDQFKNLSFKDKIKLQRKIKQDHKLAKSKIFEDVQELLNICNILLKHNKQLIEYIKEKKVEYKEIKLDLEIICKYNDKFIEIKDRQSLDKNNYIDIIGDNDDN